MNLPTFDIEAMLTEAMAAYRACPETLPPLPRVSRWRQLRSAQKLRDLVARQSQQLDLKGGEPDPEDYPRIKEMLRDTVTEMDAGRLLWDRPIFEALAERGLMETAEAFWMRAKHDEPTLRSEEIFQALRNVMIMNLLQLSFGVPVTLPDRAYAYSMLYPYTDNFIDDPSIDSGQKQAFNTRLLRTLEGQAIVAESAAEARIYALVAFIEPEYGPILRALQAAQSESLMQSMDLDLETEALLRLTFMKGGISVLADSLLVHPGLTDTEAAFAFWYGCFLQLIDDLQDHVEDLSAGHRTLFTDLSPEVRSGRIAKALHFIHWATDTQATDTADRVWIHETIRHFSTLLIQAVVGRYPAHVTSPFYRALERNSPVRLEIFPRLEAQLKTTLSLES